MTLRNADRVRETTATTGTGNITTSGIAPSSYITFGQIPSIAVSDTFYYCVAHQTLDEYETGLATWQGSNVFARTQVFQSSNGNSLVNFSAGVKDAFCGFPAYVAGNIHPFPGIIIPYYDYYSVSYDSNQNISQIAYYAGGSGGVNVATLVFTYNGALDISTAVYRLGNNAGPIIGTLTYAYDGAQNLTSVTKS